MSPHDASAPERTSPQPYEMSVVEMVEALWETVLALPDPPEPDGPAREEPGSGIAYGVRFLGAWTGRISVHASVPLAAELAAAMFGMAVEEVSEAEVADAVGELANILAGNVKSLLPAPTTLGLPEPVADDAGLPPVTAVRFIAGVEPFEVVLAGAATELVAVGPHRSGAAAPTIETWRNQAEEEQA